MLFVDTEVFKYDWMMVAIDTDTQKETVIVNDAKELKSFYNANRRKLWCAWNMRKYDQYIIKGILAGFNPKEINDYIIVSDKPGYQFSGLFNRYPLIFYDAIPNIPVSLKVMEGFLGKNIHETSVPFDIDRPLTKSEINETIAYCRDDVLNLIEVFLERKDEFNSQVSLVKEFNLPYDCLSKTQAQLAAIILGSKKKYLKDEWEIRLPDCLQLGKYKEVGEWFLNPENHDYKKKLEIKIGGVDSVIAWGGLHGAIDNYTHTCDADEVLVDADVGQLYPNLMIHYDLQSRAVTDKTKLPTILETSMTLKRAGKKKERIPYKRICNIVYGAMGDKHNAMYDPLHRNLVCIYGQVLMVDLIDKLDGMVKFINLNTDGIYFLVKRDKLDAVKQIITDWQNRVGLVMEYDEYVRIVQKDVNNYIALQANGKYHAVGAYVKDLSSIDYDLPIINKAIKQYFLYDIPPEQTILNCDNLIDFQKIVKLSSKYKWVEHETPKGIVPYTYKCYRVFATTSNYGRILKCDGVRNPAKFGNTPDHCYIENGDIRDVKVHEASFTLDKQWYIDLAKKRIKDFTDK